MGNSILRDYDAIGQVICETKGGHSTHFTYEPGGLVASITTPSGSQLQRRYTTNGLLKEELYPDGTKTTLCYDFFGRLTRETKKNITWENRYEDGHFRIIRTQLKTGESEISEFDERGNLIRFTDRAGYISEKSYDKLNRIKSERSPSGEETLWSYQGDTTLCTLPSGERKLQ